MKAIDFVLLAILLVVVGLALYHIIAGKKSSCCSTGCSGNCASCSGCGAADCKRKEMK